MNATARRGTGGVRRSYPGPDIWCEDLVRIHTTEGIEVQALQGLSLTVDPGEVVAIVGASGSGKSTLLNILSGLDKPTGGKARVAGEDLTAMTPGQRTRFRRGSVGFVFQQTSRNLLPFLSAAENVQVPMLIGGTRDRAARSLELLSLLGVVDLADRMPGQLSGGQQQRVAIATALANAPSVLLADEPTGELDEVHSAEVLDVMRHAAESLGTTVLIVTHDPMVSDHVARTIQIRDGRTSTEVLRRTVTDADGTREVAEEYTVIDRNGRIQLPAGHVRSLGLHERVRLELEPDHVGIWPGTGHSAPSRRAATDDEEDQS
ncbi:ABC-type lipoprotein export system, ATPase component [Tessaracoccus bendigoensis DSM 12906]|uniref:ABC-type lipoprotein export system, ATPase component n=1 Tax=Tessaracoccus bendigoensis DSM 12906 TaxID=1123357 RepID=A0A1M6KX49_9ACTN|nr:ABC transporter ATP-binding protein [Tessaracoccus bendigoensis]SHJ63541.1 ABC-type lipoprotein export system, ATPase component [Tessaracoccus bendigoensis DSM 12906]